METNKNFISYGIDPSKGRNYENITYVLALIYNTINTKVEHYLANYGLNTVQFNLLMLIAYQNKGIGLKQTQLAKFLIASASNITKSIDKLLKESLLSRTVNKKSRRENIICITPKGQQLIDSLWSGYDELVQKLTCIPNEHRQLAEKILADWFSNLQKEQ